jgi:carbon storage regulator
MLVLSRKIGERILVPHCELSITVLAIEGSAVRLGVSAPTEIGVYREELWQRVCSESARQAPVVPN